MKTITIPYQTADSTEIVLAAGMARVRIIRNPKSNEITRISWVKKDSNAVKDCLISAWDKILMKNLNIFVITRSMKLIFVWEVFLRHKKTPKLSLKLKIRKMDFYNVCWIIEWANSHSHRECPIRGIRRANMNFYLRTCNQNKRKDLNILTKYLIEKAVKNCMMVILM